MTREIRAIQRKTLLINMSAWARLWCWYSEQRCWFYLNIRPI